MSTLSHTRRVIRQFQALPDRHLQGLYALLVLFVVDQARRNTPDAGLVIFVAFFVVGVIRAVKHPGIIDAVWSIGVGCGVGLAAAACLRALEPQLTSAETGKLLGATGVFTFMMAAGVVIPILAFLLDEQPLKPDRRKTPWAKMMRGVRRALRRIRK
ncbi:hypothetical protein [Phenylobacterium sp.]|uniref:hypothetical protein n=1 Tax=Phenylobacterium sp. TaxID=1871053 RepID=UPI00301E5E61